MSPVASARERSDAKRVFVDVDAPFHLSEPETQTVPLVVASPHSGSRYPSDLVDASKLDADALRRSEDAHVDALFANSIDHGAPLLAALFPRAYVDVNREPYELDPAMFDEALPPYAATRSPRVAAGLGSIPRIVAAGMDIYNRRLSFAEAAARLDACYKPYHRELNRLIQTTRRHFGACLLLDAHSMPSAGLACRDDPNFGPIDIVLGDNHGRAAAPDLTDAAYRYLRDLGYAVAINDPYAGGHVTKAYGAPRAGVHVLQVEVNRALYMDEMSFERSRYFETLQSHIDGLIAALGAAMLIEEAPSLVR
jgi:N-formylglutamate amidohydrolase